MYISLKLLTAQCARIKWSFISIQYSFKKIIPLYKIITSHKQYLLQTNLCVCLFPHTDFQRQSCISLRKKTKTTKPKPKLDKMKGHSTSNHWIKDLKAAWFLLSDQSHYWSLCALTVTHSETTILHNFPVLKTPICFPLTFCAPASW